MRNTTLPKLKKGIIGIATLALLMGTVAGCKKSDSNTTSTTPTATTLPPISGADGVLVALNTQTSQTQFGYTFDIEIGSLVGAFGTLSGTQNFVDVGAISGTVSNDRYDLTKQSNNAYIYTPTAASPSGITFNGSSILWSVAGGNGFSAFTRTISSGFPSLDSITSATSSISSSAAYTLSTSDVSNSDSVIFQIAGSKGNVLVTRPANTESYTFSASDMAKVGSGYAILQIAPYNYTAHMEGGKNIYYVNETVVSKTVQVQ